MRLIRLRSVSIMSHTGVNRYCLGQFTPGYARIDYNIIYLIKWKLMVLLCVTQILSVFSIAIARSMENAK